MGMRTYLNPRPGDPYLVSAGHALSEGGNAEFQPTKIAVIARISTDCAPQSHGVEYVSMIDAFCSDIYCVVADAAGSPLPFDGEHFTMDGSLCAAKRLAGIGRGR